MPIAKGGTFPPPATASPEASLPTPAPSRDSVLRKIAEEFGKGVSANEIAGWLQAPPPSQSQKSWLVPSGVLHLSFECLTASPSEPSAWIIVQPTADHEIHLEGLVKLFGHYRKLPRGEYTWVRFDEYKPPEVTLSAMVSLSEDELRSKAVRIQFQKPFE